MNNGLNHKKEVIKMCEEHDLEYEYGVEYCSWEKKNIVMIDIDAPQGYRFEPELHYLVCRGWEDAYIRLDSYLETPLERCLDDCCVGVDV